jgi:hypothetical protein
MKAATLVIAVLCAFVGGVGSHSQTANGRRGALVFVIVAALFGGLAWHL